MRRRFFLCIALLLAAAALASCPGPGPSPQQAQHPMVRVDPDEWPVLADDQPPESLFRAMNFSRRYLRRQPPDRAFRYGPDSYSAAHLLRSLNALEKAVRDYGCGPVLNKVLAADFLLYRAAGTDGRGRVVCTGYYEPTLQGSLKKTDRYQYPLYRVPADLVTADLGEFSSDLEGRFIRGRLQDGRLTPYYSRADIDGAGALSGRGLELLWVDDQAALFFLHIQGSGRVVLPDGEVVRVGYAGKNGRRYRSIGRRMIDLGLVGPDGVSMQVVRDWLRTHPARAPEIMDHNESYIFFRRLEGEAVGAINQPLTAGRSAALDHRIFPRGAPAWLRVRLPQADGERVTGWRESSRFVLVQDTGGAIRGPGRLDLFFGPGLEAETRAGHLKEPGRLYFPVLRPPESG